MQGHESGAELLGPVSALLQVDELCWVCLLVAQESLLLLERQVMIARADILNSVQLILPPEKFQPVVPKN